MQSGPACCWWSAFRSQPVLESWPWNSPLGQPCVSRPGTSPPRTLGSRVRLFQVGFNTIDFYRDHDVVCTDLLLVLRAAYVGGHAYLRCVPRSKRQLGRGLSLLQSMRMHRTRGWSFPLHAFQAKHYPPGQLEDCGVPRIARPFRSRRRPYPSLHCSQAGCKQAARAKDALRQTTSRVPAFRQESARRSQGLSAFHLELYFISCHLRFSCSSALGDVVGLQFWGLDQSKKIGHSKPLPRR